MNRSSTYCTVKLFALSPSGESLGYVFARETWAGFLISADSEIRLLNKCDSPRFRLSSGWSGVRDFSGSFVYGPHVPYRRYLLEVA